MISFVAPSGTGKTSLIAGVLTELRSRGHRVGAVKHDAHRVELDTEGKDSWRFRQAGSEATLLMGRDQLGLFFDGGSMPPLERVVELLFPEVDLVLVEGFRSAGLPSILVERADAVDGAVGRWEPPAAELVLMTVHPGQVGEVCDRLERDVLGRTH